MSQSASRTGKPSSSLSETRTPQIASRLSTINEDKPICNLQQIAQDILRLQNISNSSLSSLFSQQSPSTSTDSSSSNSRSSSMTGSNPTSACNYLSQVEEAILRSTVPIEIDSQAEEISVLGERGLWANKAEIVNWRGAMPIESYTINEDPSPEIITKQTRQRVEYVQELAVRYLRPPSPPPPGEIIISQECNQLAPPAPPLIIRQQPPRPQTPEPLVIREAPPAPPKPICPKLIRISGKKLPPPPRKVVIERLAPLPAKPQACLIERWLPYSQVKRRVIYQNQNCGDCQVVKPKNVIVQWEAPQVCIKRQVKHLGVIRANPVEYVKRYGESIVETASLPKYVLDIETPNGIVLAADANPAKLHDLEGDLDALNLVDLDREGLGEYKEFMNKFNGRLSKADDALSTAGDGVETSIISAESVSLVENTSSSIHEENKTLALALLAKIEQCFKSLDIDSDGRICLDEAQRILLNLSLKLGRDQEETRRLVNERLDSSRHQDGFLDLNEFKRAFINLI